MRIVVFGAGAVGGLLGARLASCGEDVVLIARGAHLEAIRSNGLRVRSAVFGEFSCRPQATDRPNEVGPADIVFLTVKAHATRAAAEAITPLLGPRTAVVTAQNGIPWWYFHGLEKQWPGARLESVDPGGGIASRIGAERVIGCVVYCSSSIVQPGVIDHVSEFRFPLGEPGGERSERVIELSKTLSRAGFKAPVRSNIRHDIWVKILGNAAFNPISALTRATMGELLAFAPTRDLARSVMEEVTAAAAAMGVKIGVTVDKRMKGAEQVGRHKTSMLQDLEAGRTLEIEPIVGAVIELAEKGDVAVPNLRSLYACVKMLEKMSG